MIEGKRTGLLGEAGRVVEASLKELPDELRALADAVPVLLFEKVPSHLLEEGWDPDLLGLFEGGEESGPGRDGRARIYLFLENIDAYAEGDPEAFREEVRITFLHELGHLLELDEDDLEARGLG